jgi:hypothetical protein
MFYICFIDVVELSEDEQDGMKHVGVTTLCVKNIILISVHLLGLLCELCVNARTLITATLQNVSSYMKMKIMLTHKLLSVMSLA